MSRFKLSHIKFLFHVEGAQNSLCFENSPRFSQGYSGREQMELTTLSLFPSLSSTKILPPHQPGLRGPGSRDEPHRFDISLESTSVKWKPNSLSFLYRSVSSIQKPTVIPAREGEETALSHSLHHIKPFDELDSCCLLITGQTSQHEHCCINRSPEQSSNCLGGS